MTPPITTLFDFYGPKLSARYFFKIYGVIDGNKFTVTHHGPFNLYVRTSGIKRRLVEKIPLPANYYSGHVFYKQPGKFKKIDGRKYFDCKNRNVAGWNPDRDNDND